jgi:hypothetical protein
LNERFGRALASIGDMDGDGVRDLVVGSRGDSGGRGAVHILFLNSDGMVKASQKIASGIGGGPMLATYDSFGGSVASLGDIDGDGVTDLAVGAQGDSPGAVYVLFLNPNGTANYLQKIASGIGDAPTLSTGFGVSLASIGDIDGDGVTDLAVGAPFDDTGGESRGAVDILLLNTNGTVKSHVQIAGGTGGGPNLQNEHRFGVAVASLGDLDRDGVMDIAVGGQMVGNNLRDFPGAVHVLFLKGINSAPVFTSPASVDVSENTTAVATVTATDADAPTQTVTFSIVGGVDQSKFSITPSGVLSFIAPPDFEMPTDVGANNVYEVTVQADDSSGGTATQTISVNVTPVNEHPPVITSQDTASVAENSTSVLTVTATDA